MAPLRRRLPVPLYGVAVLLTVGVAAVPLPPQNEPSEHLETKPYKERLKELGSSSSHSLSNFQTAVSESSLGLPGFNAVAYLDDQPIIHYDSHTQRMRPLAAWMTKVTQDNPHFWDEGSLDMQGEEKLLKETLAKLLDLFHPNSSTDALSTVLSELFSLEQLFQSSLSPTYLKGCLLWGDEGKENVSCSETSCEGWDINPNLLLPSGLHTLQLGFSCEMYPDGQFQGGSWKYAYDRKNLSAFNLRNSTWTVFMPEAEILKEKLKSPQELKHYLEEKCVDWLQWYLGYRNRTLEKTEPLVRLALRKGNDSRETLTCRVYGFYPERINVTWMKDGEEQKPSKTVLPNSDGTYHSFISIDVDPKERDHYWCRVEHDSLPRPLELMWEEPDTIFQHFLEDGDAPQVSSSAVNWRLIVIGVVGGILVAAMLMGLIFFLKKWRSKNGNTSTPIPLPPRNEPSRYLETKPHEEELKELCSSSSHYSLSNFQTAVSDSSLGRPEFSAVASLDDEPFTRYDSNTQKTEPLTSWMRSLTSQGEETLFRESLASLQDLFHHHSGTGMTRKESYSSIIGDSGWVSRCSEVEGSDQESDNYRNEESSLRFPLSRDGDSGQVSLYSRDRESDQVP